MRVRHAEIPVPAVVGSILTFAVWILALVTHPGARYAGPAWLLAGLAVFVVVRRLHGEGLMERVSSDDERVTSSAVRFRRILVPMKIGLIGEEMLATAVRSPSTTGRRCRRCTSIRVPLEQPLDVPLTEQDRQAEEAIEEAKALGADHDVVVEGTTIRARAIGPAIVEHALEVDADLIVLGSAPRWRRQARFFSPTVDYVLRKAPCEVLIVAFPQSVMDEELAGLKPTAAPVREYAAPS